MAELSKDQLDVNNFLGHQYSQYKSKVYALAISKPSVYFAMREKVIQRVKTDAVKTLYTTFFTLLKDGKIEKDEVIDDGTYRHAPNLPIQDINNFTLSACATLDSICEECVNMILPIDMTTIMNRKLVQTGMGENPQG
jgi:hypothetical protein